jgi:hypothetical protein
MSQTSTQIDASGKTGAVCLRTGPYKCNKHAEIMVIFKKGDKFSVCPFTESEGSRTEGHDTTWVMVRDTDEPIISELPDK